MSVASFLRSFRRPMCTANWRRVRWLRVTHPEIAAPALLLVVLACLFLSAPSSFAQGEQVFKGKVCLGPEGRTPEMINGESSLPCTVPHAKRGARYILFNPDTKVSYELDDRAKARAFAGRSVIVVGSLNPSTGVIHIDDILAGVPPKVSAAKTVYIDCDGCVRGMAAAWKAAFEELEDWGRYDVIPDPQKADLIILLSANPYAGDFVTRDGPDMRAMKVDVTYMNVVDPRTGANLWGDSRQYGSFFVAKATRALIEELRTRLALEEQPAPEQPANRHGARKGAPAQTN
jgi:hypothetical protein